MGVGESSRQLWTIPKAGQSTLGSELGQAQLEDLLIEGIASGPAEEWTDDDWTALRSRVAGRVAEGPPARGTECR